jgi:hypothetical protein
MLRQPYKMNFSAIESLLTAVIGGYCERRDRSGDYRHRLSN